MKEYNSNIERQKYAGASKEEKARHNGVDTSRWGNDCPRVEVPDGWEDHQHTQQLIRKYLDNSFASYDFSKMRLTLSLTKDEQQALHNWIENGHCVVRKRIYINRTFKGWCIEVRIRKPEDDNFGDNAGIFEDYNGGINRVNSDVFSEVEILTREETSLETKVIEIKENYLRCNSFDVIVEPITIEGKTVSEFLLYRKDIENKGIKVGSTVEVRTDGTNHYIKRVLE